MLKKRRKPEHNKKHQKMRVNMRNKEKAIVRQSAL